MDDRVTDVIRVFIVDDHEMVRTGLRMLFETQPDIEVVGEAADAESAIGRIVVGRPDVAILDVNLPDRSGIEICRELRDRCPSVRSLMLTSFAEDEALLDAILAGACGYVLKHIRNNDLVGCVRRVAHGESLVGSVAAARLRSRIADADGDPRLGVLTAQERRILSQLADGLTNREIAEELFLSDKTVKNYVSSLLMKLGMTRRTEAAAFAARIDEHRRAYVQSTSDLSPVRY